MTDQVGVRSTGLRIVCFGQSLVEYPGNANSFLHLTRADRPDTVSSEAIPGFSFAALMNLYERVLPPHVDKGEDVDLWLIGGTGDYQAGRAAANVVADQETIAADARTFGYRNVLTSTTTPSTAIVGGGETQRLAGNLLLIDAIDPGVTFDAVVQLAEDPLLSDPNGAGYDDGTHQSLAGRHRMVELFAATGF